jgi:DNA-binding CsgD family transcriptional regulator
MVTIGAYYYICAIIAPTPIERAQAMTVTTDGLTAKQAQFCEQYVIDFNAKQTAIRAGYSPKTAEQQGYQLLQKTSVKTRIAELQEQIRERTNVTVDDVVDRLSALRDQAVEARQFGPATRAEELRGRTIGAFLDKSQITDASDLPREALAARIAKMGGGGDRDLERRFYRNFMKALPPNSFEPQPEFTDDEIDRLLDNAATRL